MADRGNLIRHLFTGPIPGPSLITFTALDTRATGGGKRSCSGGLLPWSIKIWTSFRSGDSSRSRPRQRQHFQGLADDALQGSHDIRARAGAAEHAHVEATGIWEVPALRQHLHAGQQR